jgi:thioredoxin
LEGDVGIMNTDIMEVVCRYCGTNNRVSKQRLKEGLIPRCGKCKEKLNMAGKGTVIVTDATFEEEIEKSPIPVLLDCWATWCGPCRMLAPTIEKLAEEYSGKIKVAKLDVDENPKTATKLEIMSIPTMLIYKDGKIIDTLVGAQPKAEIEKHLVNL